MSQPTKKESQLDKDTAANTNNKANQMKLKWESDSTTAVERKPFRGTVLGNQPCTEIDSVKYKNRIMIIPNQQQLIKKYIVNIELWVVKACGVNNF